ncbi:hypothetical protein HDU92_003285 [Lobulomyces angularis]|nr:hypothetical protein HDU92_003285 [Lobulomyces angularis]
MELDKQLKSSLSLVQQIYDERTSKLSTVIEQQNVKIKNLTQEQTNLKENYFNLNLKFEKLNLEYKNLSQFNTNLSNRYKNLKKSTILLETFRKSIVNMVTTGPSLNLNLADLDKSLIGVENNFNFDDESSISERRPHGNISENKVLKAKGLERGIKLSNDYERSEIPEESLFSHTNENPNFDLSQNSLEFSLGINELSLYNPISQEQTSVQQHAEQFRNLNQQQQSHHQLSKELSNKKISLEQRENSQHLNSFENIHDFDNKPISNVEENNFLNNFRNDEWKKMNNSHNVSLDNWEIEYNNANAKNMQKLNQQKQSQQQTLKQQEALKDSNVSKNSFDTSAELQELRNSLRSSTKTVEYQPHKHYKANSSNSLSPSKRNPRNSKPSLPLDEKSSTPVPAKQNSNQQNKIYNNSTSLSDAPTLYKKIRESLSESDLYE